MEVGMDSLVLLGGGGGIVIAMIVMLFGKQIGDWLGRLLDR